MNHVHVPSPDIPGFAAFTCGLPDGWMALEAPGVLAALEPVGADSMPTPVSVLISAVRLRGNVELREVAVRSLAQQRRVHPEVRIESQRFGRFGDRLTYLRVVTVPTELPAAQLHALFFAPEQSSRSVTDAFSIVASCPAADLDAFGPTFIDVVGSFRFANGANP